jgi:hypothetical protein
MRNAEVALFPMIDQVSLHCHLRQSGVENIANALADQGSWRGRGLMVRAPAAAAINIVY